jgi:hypothetical protein
MSHTSHFHSSKQQKQQRCNAARTMQSPAAAAATIHFNESMNNPNRFLAQPRVRYCSCAAAIIKQTPPECQSASQTAH